MNDLDGQKVATSSERWPVMVRLVSDPGLPTLNGGTRRTRCARILAVTSPLSRTVALDDAWRPSTDGVEHGEVMTKASRARART